MLLHWNNRAFHALQSENNLHWSRLAKKSATHPSKTSWGITLTCVVVIVLAVWFILNYVVVWYVFRIIMLVGFWRVNFPRLVHRESIPKSVNLLLPRFFFSYIFSQDRSRPEITPHSIWYMHSTQCAQE